MISIHIEAATAEQAREQMRQLLGERAVGMNPALAVGYGAGNTQTETKTAGVYKEAAAQIDLAKTQAPGASIFGDATATADAREVPGEKSNSAPEQEAKRERGQPSPGKTRRTKAEIAEDEAADKADAANKPGISTGAERVGPQDTPATAAQDAADETDDKQGGASLTHDSVRAALGAYVAKFGLEVTQEDGPKVLKMLFGEAAGKVSEIPDDQESLAKAVAGIDEMLTKNPFKRAVVEVA